jgi:hypothetical protein
MKHSFSVLLLAALACLPAQAQTLKPSQVPPAIKQALQAKFPAVKSAEWKMKSDKNYEAEFTLNGVDTAVKFDAAGKWLETESTIPRSKVPQAVQDSVARHFSGYKVIETQTLQPFSGPLIYEIHVENAKEIAKAQFSADGAVLNQSAKPKPPSAKPKPASQPAKKK